MGNAASWAGVIIAMGSLIVAFLAMRKSLHAQRDANAAQRRIVEIEERREQERQLESLQAKLQPQLRKLDRVYRLYLINRGTAEARNVRVTLDGIPLTTHPAGNRGDEMPSIVGPGAEISCFLHITLGRQPPFMADIYWDDDYETNRSYRTTITF